MERISHAGWLQVVTIGHHPSLVVVEEHAVGILHRWLVHLGQLEFNLNGILIVEIKFDLCSSVTLVESQLSQSYAAPCVRWNPRPLQPSCQESTERRQFKILARSYNNWYTLIYVLHTQQDLMIYTQPKGFEWKPKVLIPEKKWTKLIAIKDNKRTDPMKEWKTNRSNKRVKNKPIRCSNPPSWSTQPARSNTRLGHFDHYLILIFKSI